jgi:hypothetical protein
MELEVRFDKPFFDTVSREMPGAAAAALNRAAATTKTYMSSEIRAIYNIKKKDVDQTLSIQKASRNRLVATIRSRGSRLNLFLFQAHQFKGGVRVVVKLGQPKTIRSAFIATMRSGHKGVFMRKGSKRLPIAERTGPSVPELLGSKEMKRKIEVYYFSKLPKIVEDAYAFFSGKRSGGSVGSSGE